MAKVKIEYEYRGLKATPSKWFDGVVVEHQYELHWYYGSEMVNESDVNKRIKELSVIVNDYGHKKYRNIKVAS